jgi:broad specificity phosphatase PhoE
VHATIPDYRIELTPKGHDQAKEAGKVFAASLGGAKVAVYRSPFIRTRQTCLGVVSAVPPDQIFSIREDLRLREQEYGHLRGEEEQAKIEREREAYGSLYYRIPDGESGADVLDRCTTFLETLHRDFLKEDFPQRALVVTHGFTLRILIMRWLHLSPEEFDLMRNPRNCEMFDLVLQANNKFQLAAPFPQKSAEQLAKMAATRL